MKGLIFHTLKGINGWSRLQINKLDVYKIIKYKYEKREFTIFDHEYPYTLSINYYDPIQTLGVTFTFGIPFIPVLLPNYVKIEHIITKRYKTEECIIM